MDKAFTAIVRRSHSLKMTERELAAAAGVSYTTYWRTRESKTKENARVKVMRKLEEALDRRETPPCALCGQSVAKPCEMFGCPMTKDET